MTNAPAPASDGAAPPAAGAVPAELPLQVGDPAAPAAAKAPAADLLIAVQPPAAADMSLQLPATHFEPLPPAPPPGSSPDFGLPPAFPTPEEQARIQEQQQQWQQQWQQMGPPAGMYGGAQGVSDWGQNDYVIDANGYAAEPAFDHQAARQKIVQYRKEAAARRKRKLELQKRRDEQMKVELDRELESMQRRQEEREAELKKKRGAPDGSSEPPNPGAPDHPRNLRNVAASIAMSVFCIAGVPVAALTSSQSLFRYAVLSRLHNGSLSENR